MINCPGRRHLGNRRGRGRVPARRKELVGTALTVLTEEDDTDGRLRLGVTFQDSRHAVWALWQLATSAEVLAPQWLRTSLRDRGTAIAVRYEDPC